MDAELPDLVMQTLRSIAAAADRIATSEDVGVTGRDELNLEVLEILAAEPFAEQEAAEKLVRYALRD